MLKLSTEEKQEQQLGKLSKEQLIHLLVWETEEGELDAILTRTDCNNLCDECKRINRRLE
jgi:hypothetical protein